MSMDKAKQERKVIHLQLDNEHFYYGSIASLFEDYDEAILGFNYYKVKNFLGKLGVMENEKCTIRQGILKTKQGERGRKKTDEKK